MLVANEKRLKRLKAKPFLFEFSNLKKSQLVSIGRVLVLNGCAPCHGRHEGLWTANFEGVKVGTVLRYMRFLENERQNRAFRAFLKCL